MKLHITDLSKKEQKYVASHAEHMATRIVSRASFLQGDECCTMFFGEAEAEMADVLRQALAPHLKDQGIHIMSQWDDEDGGWTINISRSPFSVARDEGLGVAMMKSLYEMEKGRKLPQTLSSGKSK